ncbi:MAG: RHS repeat-associated core domain-containing protein [Candidatus Omnitrophota bacterium]
MERAGESYYYHTDGLGSIVAITDSTQDIINSYTYDSFGNITEQTGALPNPYTYTGREYDSETELYYYRARYYNSRTGRFLSEDPIGFWGGNNFYTYCFNNPISWIDPFGLCAKSGAEWWLYESVVPGPYGQPMSEWGSYGPTGWGDPMRYTEEAGGGWMWAERIAVGTSAAAALTAGGLMTYEAVTGIRFEFHLPHPRGPHRYPHFQEIKGPGRGKTIGRWPRTQPSWWRR